MSWVIDRYIYIYIYIYIQIHRYIPSSTEPDETVGSPSTHTAPTAPPPPAAAARVHGVATRGVALRASAVPYGFPVQGNVCNVMFIM